MNATHLRKLREEREVGCVAHVDGAVEHVDVQDDDLGHGAAVVQRKPCRARVVVLHTQAPQHETLHGLRVGLG